MLEDGFYVLELILQDKDKVIVLVCFVCVMMKGFEYVVVNFKEVVDIVLENDEIGVQIEVYQLCMVEEVVKLIEGLIGVLDLVDYQCMVDMLLLGGLDLVIIKVFEGVYVIMIIDCVFD